MVSDDNILRNTKQWLIKNQHSQMWLADRMGVAPSLISQLFSGERKLQPAHIEKIALITHKTITELADSPVKRTNEITYSVCGKISTSEGERALEQLLLDVEHYVHLLV